MNRIIVVTGQTATGKTALALKLAKDFNGELINCDSRQIYKHLDIITGKDLTDHTFHHHKKLGNFDIGYYILAGNIPIWLYDVVYPNEHFSSFDYTICAYQVIEDIIKRNKTPIIVGGSYFYLKHLLYGFDTRIEPNWELRKTLETKPVAELQDMLRKLNTPEFEKLNESDRSNPRRLIRRIEILSHEPSSTTTEPNGLIHTHKVELNGIRYLRRDIQRRAVTKRVEERLAQGAVNEVKKLLQKGYTDMDPGLQTIGYGQVLKFLSGKITEERMKQEWIVREIQYAKRQYTFMKKDLQINWKEI